LNKQIIKGTFILAAAGFLTRILGFFYRIFLSNNIGALGMGLFQMIMPIYGLCYSISAAGLHTAISKAVAESNGTGYLFVQNKDKHANDSNIHILSCGLKISLALSVILSAMLFIFSPFIAGQFLGDVSCSRLLKIAALSIPLCSMHSCITGYYLGLKKAFIPGFSQLMEQFARIMFVIVATNVLISSGSAPDASTAVYGLLAGELVSALLCFITLSIKHKIPFKSDYPAKQLLNTAIPLTSTKVMLSFLNTLEAMLVPSMLIVSGLSSDESISTYGILTGMAFPFIFFPSTITNAISSMLLPEMAEARSSNNIKKIRRTIGRTLRYSLIMGIFCTGIFLMYGTNIGTVIYNNPTAGRYIVILGWLCPFLYISTTFGSILNGLGLIKSVFLHNVISLIARILFVILCVPHIGITGYLWGILASEIICSVLHFISLKKCCTVIESDAVVSILIPACAVTLCVTAVKKMTPVLTSVIKFFFGNSADIPVLLFCIFVTGLFFLGLEIFIDRLLKHFEPSEKS